MSAASRTIVLASRNKDKLRELRQICAGLPFDVASSLDFPGLPDVIEDGTSALGNAARKALVTAGWTGEIAVADDTTFQVRALGGLPDIFASRFAGDDATYRDNVDMALDLMQGVPDDAREVRFETQMVWVDPHPTPSLGMAAVAPAQARWVHDPFSSLVVPDDRLAAQVARKRLRGWAEYLAWFGTLPVSWGADNHRATARAGELVAPFLSDDQPLEAPAGSVRIPDPEIWTAAGPDDRRRPAMAVDLDSDAPGRMRCAPVWFELASSGRLLGNLARQPLGRGGFGYDPVVVPVGSRRTLAEFAADEKNAISHRGRAMRRLMDVVSRVYRG